MFKKIYSTVALITVSTTISFASYSAVIDYSKSNLDAANSLAEQWIINDHKNDTQNYNLIDNVLRQEIAAVARWVAKLDKKSKCDNIFSDLSDTNPNTWACRNVEVLVDNDLISRNDTFRPEDKITKSEAIAMLIKAIGFDYNYDNNNSNNWQKQVVDYAADKWVISNFSDYNTDATRGWVFMVADTTIKKDIEIKKIIEMKEKKKYSDEAM